MAGERRPSEPDVAAESAALGLQDRVLVLGYLAEEEVTALLAATDLLVNLRFPTMGETSGTVMRALSRGVCTIVSDVGAFRDLPAVAVVRLPWDSSIRERLRAALIRLGGSPAERAGTGAAAAQWCQEACSLASCAKAYAAVLQRAYTVPARPWNAAPATWRRPSRAVDRARTSGPLWRSTGLLPDPAGCSVLAVLADAAEVALLAADGIYPVQTILAGSSPDWIGALADRPPRSLDIVLISIEDHCLADDAGPLLRAVNAQLGFGGILVFEVRRGTGLRPNDLLQYTLGQRLLRYAGFDVENVAVAPPIDLDWIEEPRDRRIWCAAKVSEFTHQPPRT